MQGKTASCQAEGAKTCQRAPFPKRAESSKTSDHKKIPSNRQSSNETWLPDSTLPRQSLLEQNSKSFGRPPVDVPLHRCCQFFKWKFPSPTRSCNNKNSNDVLIDSLYDDFNYPFRVSLNELRFSTDALSMIAFPIALPSQLGPMTQF